MEVSLKYSIDLWGAEEGRIPGKTAEQHKKRRETRRGVEVRKVDTRNNKHCSSGTFPSKSMYKII